MPAVELPTADVLGVDVAVADVERAADAVIQRALSGEGGYAVLCNVHVLMTARRRWDVMRAVRGACMVFADGAPVAWVQRRRGHRRARRVPGPDLMPAVLDRGRGSGVTHALVGSTPTVVERLEARIRRELPGTEVVATIAPPAGAESTAPILTQLRAAHADVIWLALGAPKQEIWMRRHGPDLRPALVVGVGAAFDFGADVKIRAPILLRSAGLEWLHRLATEPRRLSRRYLVTNSQFAFLVVPLLMRLARARLRDGRLAG